MDVNDYYLISPLLISVCKNIEKMLFSHSLRLFFPYKLTINLKIGLPLWKIYKFYETFMLFLYPVS